MTVTNHVFTPRATLTLLEAIDATVGSRDTEQALMEVLNMVLEAFGCDRVALIHPLETYADTFEVAYGVAAPGFEGVYRSGTVLEMQEIDRAAFKMTVAKGAPVAFDIETVQTDEYAEFRQAFIAEENPREFKAALAMVIHPFVGPPWAFLLDHCRKEHVFSDDEIRVFELVARRVADALALRLVRERLSDVSSLEALGLMISDTAQDLSSIVDKIESGLQASGSDELARLQRETQLIRRVLDQITSLSNAEPKASGVTAVPVSD